IGCPIKLGTHGERDDKGEPVRGSTWGSRIVRLGVLWALLISTALALIATSVADAAEGPLNSSPPSISGTVRDAQRLKASKGAWAGQKPISYSYQWTRCDASGSECGEIGSARKASYKAGHADVGHTLRVVVSASDPSGRTSAT